MNRIDALLAESNLFSVIRSINPSEWIKIYTDQENIFDGQLKFLTWGTMVSSALFLVVSIETIVSEQKVFIKILVRSPWEE